MTYTFKRLSIIFSLIFVGGTDPNGMRVALIKTVIFVISVFHSLAYT